MIWNASKIHHSTHAVVFDGVVQEIDIKTGLVLFQWDSLDHVPLADSYTKFRTGRPYDFFHLNSIEQDDDGNLLIGGRSVSALYKVNHSTGAVMWQLGGKRSSFKFGAHASFAFAHDPRMRAKNDAVFSIFDNGAGLYHVHKQSRALWLNLNFKTMTATRAKEIDHSPPLLARWAGNVQQLDNGDTFVGWGEQPYFSEYNSKGKLLFDARFADRNISYRTYRFDWNGYPKTRPAVAASNSGNDDHGVRELERGDRREALAGPGRREFELARRPRPRRAAPDSRRRSRSPGRATCGSRPSLPRVTC